MGRSAARTCWASRHGCVIIAASDFPDVAPAGADCEYSVGASYGGHDAPLPQPVLIVPVVWPRQGRDDLVAFVSVGFTYGYSRLPRSAGRERVA